MLRYVLVTLAAIAAALITGFAAGWGVAARIATLAAVVAGVVVAIIFVSPEALMRLGFRIRVSNNLQLLLLWGFVIASGIGLRFLLGAGPAPSHGSDYVQSHYNLYFHGTFQTDRGMRGWRGGFGDVLRGYGWGAWWLLFAAAIVYVPVALREEFAEAARRAVDAVHRERAHRAVPTTAATTVAAPATAATAGGAAAAPVSPQFLVFIREFFAALFSEIAAKGLVARGRP